MVLPIRLYGDPVLRTNCKKINVINNNIYNIINDMFDTMYKSYGVGLAAPQVGKNLRVFIIDVSTYKTPCKRVFINPEIVKLYGKTWKLKEGCLSFPFFVANIIRYESIIISYYNEYMEKCEETFQGFSSRVIQHELDHVEGKLFIDYFK